MIKVSTKGDYGLLFLVSLAGYPRGSFVPLSAIATSRHLSPKYLSHLVPQLKRAGLISSKEGVDGGYQLARLPEEITLAEVMDVLEGKVNPVRCMHDTAGMCQSESYCTTKNVWSLLQEEIYKFLRQRTLADFLPKRDALISIGPAFAKASAGRRPQLGRHGGLPIHKR